MPGGPMTDEDNLIDYLRDFNRKERFILLSHVLGGSAEEVFRLDPAFARRLEKQLGLTNQIPECAFVAMDYHLDWIQMALHLHLAEWPSPHPRNVIPNPNNKLFEANQEDIDLLVAFEDEASQKVHLVLIEAKADTGWTNKQLNSKAGRLRRIFDKCVLDVVTPHFVLMSPSSKSKRKRKIDTNGWPPWMKREKTKFGAHWLELPLRDELLRVTRCNDLGYGDKDGDSLFVSLRRGGKWLSWAGF